jgi:hypothetical protein
LTVSLAGRFFDERHRVKKDEYVSEALWTYRVAGAELAVDYNPTDWLSFNAHVGGTFAGRLKIANRHYEHRVRYNLDGGPYAGGEVSVNF